MAKNDKYLFDRLRQAGLRKQVAKTLSEIGEGASKQALRAARTTVAELRSLADELERRLPGPSASGQSAGRMSTQSPAAAPRASRPRAGGRRARRPVTQRKSAPARGAKTATASRTNGARAPRGENKAKILASLEAGPKTASVVAKETGIGTGTVGSTLSKLATAGEVVKADRGYGLPK